MLTVDLHAALDSGAPAVPIFPDDSVTVFSIRGPRTRSVDIAGSVWQSGRYQLNAGMRLWDAIRVAGGLRPETYAGRVQIVRSLADSTRELIGVVLDSVSPANNPPLQEQDRIRLIESCRLLAALR